MEPRLIAGQVPAPDISLIEPYVIWERVATLTGALLAARTARVDSVRGGAKREPPTHRPFPHAPAAFWDPREHNEVSAICGASAHCRAAVRVLLEHNGSIIAKWGGGLQAPASGDSTHC
jgi:hypothetical protein